MSVRRSRANALESPTAPIAFDWLGYPSRGRPNEVHSSSGLPHLARVGRRSSLDIYEGGGGGGALLRCLVSCGKRGSNAPCPSRATGPPVAVRRKCACSSRWSRGTHWRTLRGPEPRRKARAGQGNRRGVGGQWQIELSLDWALLGIVSVCVPTSFLETLACVCGPTCSNIVAIPFPEVVVRKQSPTEQTEYPLTCPPLTPKAPSSRFKWSSACGPRRADWCCSGPRRWCCCWRRGRGAGLRRPTHRRCLPRRDGHAGRPCSERARRPDDGRGVGGDLRRGEPDPSGTL